MRIKQLELCAGREEPKVRTLLLAAISLVLLIGCSQTVSGPTVPDVNPGVGTFSASSGPAQDNHILWGSWKWFIPETHDRIDVVPVRMGNAHMNVLKLLEVECPTCLEITNIHNNGDSTLNVTVRIKHPRPTEAQYTGFDVKGILIFNASYELPSNYFMPQYPEPMRISWKELGDPEVLNPDGYTIRWSLSYDSGSTLPLLNYWKGKYASEQEPNGNLNAYLNFYKTQERHMFSVSGIVERTYHIYLPPGPLVAGYSVEACWAPPDVMPVTNPLDDFPKSANMDEPYVYKVVVNYGEPITTYCCGWDYDCTDLYYEIKQWNGVTVNAETRHHNPDDGPGFGGAMVQCDNDPGHYLIGAWGYSYSEPGIYRGYGVVKRYTNEPPYYYDQLAYSVFDWIKP